MRFVLYVCLTTGQLVVAALLEKGMPVKAVLRSEEKARTLFGEHDPKKFQVHISVSIPILCSKEAEMHIHRMACLLASHQM